MPFGRTVNALVGDAKTGSMLALIEGRARAEGSANPELRKQVLRAALHSAVSKIPTRSPRTERPLRRVDLEREVDGVFNRVDLGRRVDLDGLTALLEEFLYARDVLDEGGA